MREGPGDPAPGQTRPHVRVVEHVKRIVIIYELVMEGLPEHRPCDRDQKDADAEQRPARLFGAHVSQFKTASMFFQVDLCLIRLAIFQQRLA